MVHNSSDTVSVVVVEDATKSKDLVGLLMESGENVTITAGDDIPLGHKIAVSDIADGNTIVKYGHDIGKAVAAIARGGHAHTQNIKTKRW